MQGNKDYRANRTSKEALHTVLTPEVQRFNTDVRVELLAVILILFTIFTEYHS